MPGSAAPLLTASRVSVAFGGLQALDGVSFDIGPGEVLGLIGPNGAGKTTLFNVICGFVPARPGDLRWDGRPLGRVRPRQLARLGIARTQQGLGLFAGLTVLENVMVGTDVHRRAGAAAALLGTPRSARDEAALRARALAQLDSLGIADAAPAYPAALPYGVRKRVALARALVSRPRLLLLDEPASGLSEAEVEELAGLLRSLRGQLAVMLVEHHMDLVMAVCDRIVVLDFGKVIATGDPDEIRSDPAVLDAYLGQEIHPSDSPGEHEVIAP